MVGSGEAGAKTRGANQIECSQDVLGRAGLAVQARAYLSEREVEFADNEGEGPLDFSHMGAVLAHGILTLADPVVGQAR